jgi:hypothetical protein
MEKIDLLIERYHALFAARQMRRAADQARLAAQYAEELEIHYANRARELERYLAEVGEGEGDGGEIVIGID